MHFFCILEKRQVIKMMFKYELKKIFSKRMNKVLLAAVLVMTVIYSGMAIGSMSYTDADGQIHTGIDAGRLLAEDVNQWKGKLTTEKISEVINDYKTLSAKYQDEIPNTEYGKTVQSYYDIYSFVIGILTPDSEWNEGAVYQLSDEQLQDIYTIYQDNMKKMAEEYGTTPEKRSYLENDRNTFYVRSKRFLGYDDNVRTNLCTINGSDHRFFGSRYIFRRVPPRNRGCFFCYKVREIEGNKKQDYCRNLRVNGYLLDRSRDIVSYLICSNGNEWIFHTVSD